MVQIVKQATPWGEVAGGFGKGIGEAIEDVSTRYVTNRGLTQINEAVQSGQLTDRFSIFQALQRIPGMTADKLQTYMPLVEEMIQRQSLSQFGAQDPRAQQQEATPVTADQAVTIGKDAEPKYQGRYREETTAPEIQRLASRVSPELEAGVFAEKIPKDPRTVAALASDFMQQNPGRYAGRTQLAEQDASSAIDAHNERIELNKERRNLLATETENIRSAIEKRLMKRLQVDDIAALDQKLPPSIRENILQEAIADSDRNNESVETLADKYSRKALGIQRKFNEFDKLRPIDILAQPSKATLGRFEEARKFFQQYGDMEDLRSYIEGKGYSSAFASSVAYPLDANQKQAIARWDRKKPNIREAIMADAIDMAEWAPQLLPMKAVKNIMRKAGFNTSEQKRQQKIDAYTAEYADYLLDEVYKPGTSFETLSLMMANQNLDNQVLYEKVRERRDSGELTLEPHQEREIQASRPVRATMTDLLVSTGFVPGKEVPQMGFFEMIRRFSGK